MSTQHNSNHYICDHSHFHNRPQPAAVVEDEWKEFEAEERKDYTGLKIGQLQIENESDDTADDAAYEKYDSEGELNVDGERQRTGPWNKTDAESTGGGGGPPAVAAVAPEKGASYVLPALRSGLGGLAVSIRLVVVRVECAIKPC